MTVEVTEVLVVTASGLLVGAAAMYLYLRLSPRATLAELKSEASQIRREMFSYDGDDFSVMSGLTRRSLSNQLQQFKLVFVPTLVSALPVVAVMVALDFWIGDNAILGFGPDWLHGWFPLHVGAISLAAVIIKFAFPD